VPTSIIQGVFEPVELWRTKSGETFTVKLLAEYRAKKDGDSDPMSGGYPIGPSLVGHGYRRVSDGHVFLITQVERIGDERARKDIAADRQYLDKLGDV